MLKIRILLLIVILSTLFSVATAQEEEIPVVAILKFGDIGPLNSSEQGTLDIFEAYGYVDGENVQFILGEAQLNVELSTQLVEFALENEADVIIAIATPIAIAAYNLTLDMENPPIILFNSVTSPYGAGIAVSACQKPDHISGSQAFPPYDVILPTIFNLDPSIETIGVIYNDEEINSVISVGIIENVSQELGIDIIAQSIATSNLARVAAEAMIMSGIDVFLIPTDSTAVNAMSDISDISIAAQIPVFAADVGQISRGATVAIGLDYYQEGVDTGIMAINYLENNLNIADLAISSQTEVIVGVNLDSAVLQDLEISAEFLETADFYVEDGINTETGSGLPNLSLEERQELDDNFLATLECTEERIAEEQATLDTED